MEVVLWGVKVELGRGFLWDHEMLDDAWSTFHTISMDNYGKKILNGHILADIKL